MRNHSAIFGYGMAPHFSWATTSGESKEENGRPEGKGLGCKRKLTTWKATSAAADSPQTSLSG